MDGRSPRGRHAPVDRGRPYRSTSQAVRTLLTSVATLACSCPTPTRSHQVPGTPRRCLAKKSSVRSHEAVAAASRWRWAIASKLTTEPRGEKVVALVLARLRSPRVLLSLAHRRPDEPSASPRIADPIEVTADGGDVEGPLVGVPEGACHLTHKSATWAKICVKNAKWRIYASNSR